MTLPDQYFTQPRRDVASLIPQGAHKVLDVGCGYGALGRLLVSERSCAVHGVERNPNAAAHLRGTYERFVQGDVEASVDMLRDERYDCIVFADILEHLADPWTALARYRALLAPEGSIVASIPNVRNFVVLFNLVVRGHWTYADTGLLDRTHLRFFTRAEIILLFGDAGLVIDRIAVNRDRYRPWQWLLTALPALIIPDLTVCQFLVRAHTAERK